MKLRPLGDRIVVRAEKPRTTTASGLHIPESSRSPYMRGEVLAAGPGLGTAEKPEPVSVKAGDVILFHTAGRVGMIQVEELGEDVFVINESILIGVVEN